MKLTKQQILEKLKEIYTEMSQGNQVAERFDEDVELRTGLALTSVAMLYFVIILEDAFAIQFDGDSLGDFVTVGDVVNYIWSKQQ